MGVELFSGAEEMGRAWEELMRRARTALMVTLVPRRLKV